MMEYISRLNVLCLDKASNYTDAQTALAVSDPECFLLILIESVMSVLRVMCV
jgi:hypothetical protein